MLKVDLKHFAMDNLFNRINTQLEELVDNPFFIHERFIKKELIAAHEYLLKNEAKIRVLLAINPHHSLRIDKQISHFPLNHPVNIVQDPEGNFRVFMSAYKRSYVTSSQPMSEDIAWAIDEEDYPSYTSVTLRHPEIKEIARLAEYHGYSSASWLTGQLFRHTSQENRSRKEKIRRCELAWEQSFYSRAPAPLLPQTPLLTTALETTPPIGEIALLL